MNQFDVLKTYFGYDSFREGQEELIEGILAGKDVLAIMPTGAGKSVCYQVPAMLLPGMTLVISPLISLMQDQVDALKGIGIAAQLLNSSVSSDQMEETLRMAEQGAYKILYVAPERLENHAFLRFAHKAKLSMVTVDEAHCISQWGQDFRPSYLKITEFVEGLPERPIVSAFTATATPEVKADIQNALKLVDPIVVSTGFDRKNLHYQVEHVKQKDTYILDYVKTHLPESGIIYCSTRKNVEQLFALLVKSGIPAAKYHAGMAKEERKNSQEQFVYDRIPIMVATNAFGMGIDKSNVRFVIHYNMPQSMENYYQEAGRAGRDGEEARCILLFSRQDVTLNRYVLDQKDFSEMEYEEEILIRERDLRRLHAMEYYCCSANCLRNTILQYFGEKRSEACGSCGNCEKDHEEKDLTEAARWMLQCVQEYRGRYGASIVIGTLRGSKKTRLKEIRAREYASFGKLAEYSAEDLQILLNQMIQEEYLVQTSDRYPVVRRGRNAGRLKEENTRILIRFFKEKAAEQVTDHTDGQVPEAPSSKIGTSMEQAPNARRTKGKASNLFEALRKVRMAIAREERIPPYIVFSDKSLVDMCVKLPHTLDEFLTVNGVGENKKEKYGERFLQAIRTFEEMNHSEE